MINADVIENLKKEFSSIHPLIFHRSLEKTKTSGDLFDLLSDLKDLAFPIIWNESNHKWEHTDNIFQTDNLVKKIS